MEREEEWVIEVDAVEEGEVEALRDSSALRLAEGDARGEEDPDADRVSRMLAEGGCVALAEMVPARDSAGEGVTVALTEEGAVAVTDTLAPRLAEAMAEGNWLRDEGAEGVARGDVPFVSVGSAENDCEGESVAL